MTSTITQETSLEAFFYERLTAVQEGRAEELSTEIEAYIVHLLAEFARRPAVAGRTSAPLALQYLKARSAGTHALRDVGDRALYIAGAVPSSLDRGAVGVGYVQGIGEAAYRGVHEQHPRLEVFAELADAFEDITAVVADAVEPSNANAGSLLELYARWRIHRRSRDAKRLVEAGVLLDPERSDLLQ
ncbi:MAG: hypothetical protein V3V08_16925 [Nannocystaceae bacterium]